MKSVLDIPDSPYSIEYDGDLNWTLCERRGPRVHRLSYHATPDDALRACLRLLATVSAREAITEWLDRLNAVNTRIDATAKKLIKGKRK